MTWKSDPGRPSPVQGESDTYPTVLFFYNSIINVESYKTVLLPNSIIT